MSLSQPSQELLADLHKLEASAVFLCRWPEIELLRLGGLTKGYLDWEEVFRGLVSWLQRSSACDLYPRIIDRFKNRPKGFHIELSSDRLGREASEDSTDLDYLETAVVLILNGYNCWDSPTFRKILKNPPSSFTFRATDCHCDPDGDSLSSSHSHKRYVAACLRALKALVSRTLYYHSDSIDGPVRNDIFKGLVDSSLLQHCAFSAESLAQCRILFSLPTDDLCVGIPLGEVEQRRTKLLEWLETCPQCYAAEAEALKAQVVSLMRTGDPCTSGNP
ncbi:hypothetical protein PM082_015925 [Marasmius tenuissimus]|nr:hypothetical protein PM082_015925 [Marasmius tenuissimus]